MPTFFGWTPKKSPFFSAQKSQKSRRGREEGGGKRDRHKSAPAPLPLRCKDAGRGEKERADQCRKWRRPVKSMARPSSSQAAITSSSLREPPGWTTATTPALAAAWIPSGNGKKASDPMTAPRLRSPAFSLASRTESTRLICPAPTPTTLRSATYTMAFDFTRLATIQANLRSASWAAVGDLRVTTFHSAV